MRDLLNDLEQGKGAADPMAAARRNMKAPLPRRFYKSADAGGGGGAHAVQLDGKPALTPGRRPLLLPTAAAARLVAGEFDAQAEFIDPATMPVMRLVNTAIDGVADDPQAVLEDILRFAGSDMLCYRAEAPQTLVDRQAAAWNPVLDWAQSTLGARFILAEGVMPVTQPRETIAVLGAHLKQRAEPFRLAALHVITTTTGSALLALALDAGAAVADEVWAAAHIDEDWNIEQWGEDAEAAARRQMRHREMMAAASLLEALGDKG